MRVISLIVGFIKFQLQSNLRLNRSKHTRESLSPLLIQFCRQYSGPEVPPRAIKSDQLTHSLGWVARPLEGGKFCVIYLSDNYTNTQCKTPQEGGFWNENSLDQSERIKFCLISQQEGYLIYVNTFSQPQHSWFNLFTILIFSA